MNTREALQSIDPARRLPTHHLDAGDEAQLQQILGIDRPQPASPAPRRPRRDWKPALVTGIVAVAVIAGTFAVIRTTSGDSPAPARTSVSIARTADRLEVAVQARLAEAAGGQDTDPDQHSQFWTEAQRGAQGDMIELSGKTLYLAAACTGGGEVTIEISGEADTVLDCATFTTIGPIDLTELLNKQGKGISMDVVATAGRPRYLVKELAFPDSSPRTEAPAQAAARDLGPREHARGIVTKQQDDKPTQYRVAADDNAGAICHRFERRWWQLTDETGTPLGTYPILQPGQLIGINNAPLSDYSALQLSDNNALC